MKKILFKTILKWTLGTILLFGITLQSEAQINHINAQNLGMGGAGTAFTHDYNAVFLNPANLMFNDRNTTMSFGFFGGGIGAGGPVFNLGVYNDYFTSGRTIDATTSVELTDIWFGDGTNASGSLGTHFDIVPVGFSIRTPNQAFGVAFRSRFNNTNEMDKGMVKLGLSGFDSDIFSSFTPVNVSTDVMSTAEIAVSYARKLWEKENFYFSGTHKLYAGISPVYVMGFGYTSFSMDSELRIRDQEEDLTHNYTITMQTVGQLSDEIQRFVDDVASSENSSDLNFGDYLSDGFGDINSMMASGININMGLTYEWDRGEIAPSSFLGSGRSIVRISLTAQDLGAITFDNNAREFTSSGSFHWEGFDFDQERIDNDFNGERSEYIEYVLTDSLVNEVYLNFTGRDVDQFTRRLSPTVTLGSAVTYGRASAVLDIGKGFNDRGIQNDGMFLSLGGEYRIADIIPIRAGLRLGGFTSNLYSFGTGLSLRNLELSFGTMTRPSSGDRGNAMLFAWSGLNLKF